MNTVQPIREIGVINDIADYLRVRSERNYVLFMFGIYTGLRISDILKLRVRDVKNKDYIFIREQKTGKEKRFPINKKLKKILDNYAKTRKDFEYLFRSRKGMNKPLRREQVYKILKDASEAFGLECIGCHTMRKTFGYFLYRDTKDAATLKEIFNHADISTTMRYIGVNQEKKDEVMAKLDFDRK